MNVQATTQALPPSMMKTALYALTLMVLVMASTGDADAEDHVVTQSNMSFSATDLTVKVGDTVSFSNRDSMAHNVYSLSDAKTFDLGSSAPNTSKKVTLDQPGVVDVECALHPSMRMKIKVTQ
ncbi:Plastocyanin [Hydrocarboniphaga daqingensis]|uniref:Plastocyanin n=1 Tax=Hydrocarboniphaga daqingensis TaxID=490188 RepID=A0A1M5LYR0_9GAMM|nr:plastocyanin/azurin family copper-binding protein [Hydrocarboniphaga daqingensis]SHG70232.1 Plastocyanin [Hydrocarboniphaga daqingensis]